MTREEAIRCLSVHSSTNGSGLCTDKQHYEAKQVAIKELEKEPCEVEATKLQQAYNKGFETCKQAVLDEIPVLWNSNGDKDYCMESLRDFITELPPVTPKPKMGRWMYGEDNLGTGRDGWYCNQCGHFEFWDYKSDAESAKLNLPNFCPNPNCGAKMQAENEVQE